MATVGGLMACLRRSPPPAQYAASMKIMILSFSTLVGTGESVNGPAQISDLLSASEWDHRFFFSIVFLVLSSVQSKAAKHFSVHFSS